jgi:hypothetical protein
MAKRRQNVRLSGIERLFCRLPLFSLLSLALAAQSAEGRPHRCPATTGSHVTYTSETKPALTSIPRGTILPVRLNATLSSVKSKANQAVTARIMQSVPLPDGSEIPRGSKVEGRIVEVVPGSGTAGARISLQFDKLRLSHQVVVPIVANLRAIAGFMEVFWAQTPAVGPGFGDVFRWMTTIQIGGDVVYGEGGPVTSAENGAEVLGTSVHGGVLVPVRANEKLGCRGEEDGGESLQALWVFSSNACGTYGLEHVQVPHAGRTDPIGVITFASDSGRLRIPSGAGMLLRVRESSR